VPIFTIPINPKKEIIVNKHSSSYNGIEFESLDSTITELEVVDSLNSIDIKTFAIRRGFRDGIWEQQFLLENGNGFRKFWEYELTKIP
jgi:hypothetical protein